MLLAILLPMLAAAQVEPGKAEAPVQIPDLNSSALEARPHPFLFATDAERALAVQRIPGDPSLRGALDRLREQAEKGLAVELEPLDRSWYDEVKDHPWKETYPIFFEKTWRQPSRMATPLGRMAECSVLTGEERFADAARRVLLHLADYTFEYEHYDVGMNYSVWGYRALEAYDLLFDRFGVDERARIDGFFTRMGRAVLANDTFWVENRIGGGVNNHLAWHKMMLGMLGAFYGHPDLIDYAVHGPMGIAELLELGLVDDGLWCESSLNYHFTAIVPMTLLADVVRRTGCHEDLFQAEFADGRTLKQPFDAMFGVLFPDGTIPPIGDAYAHRSNLADQWLYGHAFRAYGDPRYAWLLSRAKERSLDALFLAQPLHPRETPPVGTCLYPEHGYAFLRSRKGAEYWDSDAWCAFLTYDKSGVHSNADKLSLMLFGKGQLLIPDVEARATVPHAFSSRVQRELNRGTLSQNTVMIDGSDQTPAPRVLWLIEYRDLPGEKRATAADLSGILYPGVRQQRTVCVTEGYVLDVFQVVSEGTHEIEWILHGPKGAGEARSNLSFTPGPERREGAWSWIRDLRSAETDGSWWVEWDSEGLRFRVSMQGAEGTRVIHCGYPTTDEAECPTFPMLVVRRQAEGARFLVLYQAGREPLGALELAERMGREGRFRLDVTGPDQSRSHTIPLLR